MSRRAVKRYEEALASEKRAAGYAVETGQDGAKSVAIGEVVAGTESPVATSPANMFGALLGGDEEEEDEDEDNAEEQVASTSGDNKLQSQTSYAADPANGTGKRRRKKKGKKNGKPQDDEDWYVGDTAAAATADSAKDEIAALDLLNDIAYIPDSYFGLDDDEALRASAREVLAQVIDIAYPDGVIPGALEALAQISRGLVAVNPVMLSADTELKRLFGARVVEHERVTEAFEEAQKRRRQRAPTPRTKRPCGHLVQPRDTWWKNAPGLGMIPDEVANKAVKDERVEGEENVRYFRYTFERRYQLVQRDFEAVVLTHNPSLLVELVSRAPYHVDTLLQLGEVHRQMGELERAGELVERALYVLEATWTRSFKPFNGDCRLRYAVPENRSLFLALFRHVQLLTRRGLVRTALEAAKLMLNLDPPFDPLGVLMMVDSLALLSGEFGWVRAMHRDYAPCALELFPNFAISAALAAHLQDEASGHGGIKAEANGKSGKPGKKKKKQSDDRTLYIAKEDDASVSPLQKMTNALLAFPMVLEPLLVALDEDTQVCSQYDIFKSDDTPSSVDDGGILLRIARVYAETSKIMWKGSSLALLKDAAKCAGAAAAGGRGSDGLDLAAEARRLREDSASFFRRSGAYNNLQIADFGGSATNVPAELIVPEGNNAAPPLAPNARRGLDLAAAPDAAPVRAPVRRTVSTREAAMEFLRSFMPWYTPTEPEATPAEVPMHLDAGDWDQLQGMLARREDADGSDTDQ
jgi:tetratricopeptide (TPR) repeat protein